MERLREDGSYTGELTLCEELVQARDERISHTSIEPVYYYHIGVPRHLIAHIRHTRGTKRKHTTKTNNERVGPITPELRGSLTTSPENNLLQY